MTGTRVLTLLLLALLSNSVPAFAYEPIITMAGEEQVVTPAAQTIHVLASAAQTDGELGLIIIDGKAGEGPGPSITHSKESETWYVLEGSYEFHVGDQVIDGGPGTFISVDAGQPHGFINKTDGKLMIVFTPGGYEDFFVQWDAKDLPRGPELGALEQTYGVTRPAP
ncbi:MAG: cupin domain-containing protein [Devosia sp.]